MASAEVVCMVFPAMMMDLRLGNGHKVGDTLESVEGDNFLKVPHVLLWACLQIRHPMVPQIQYVFFHEINSYVVVIYNIFDLYRQSKSMPHPDHHLELMMQKFHGVETVLEEEQCKWGHCSGLHSSHF